MKYMELGVTAAAEVPCYPHHFRAMAHEVPTWTGDFGLSEIKVPTFIVHGDSDKMVGNKNAENLHAAVEGSKYLRVEEGNHCIPLHTDAAKILQQQVDFVKEHHK
jgi:pimeloyl-ACP methyl ester carboxylesterase